jgi:hypothetical protein
MENGELKLGWLPAGHIFSHNYHNLQILKNWVFVANVGYLLHTKFQQEVFLFQENILQPVPKCETIGSTTLCSVVGFYRQNR